MDTKMEQSNGMTPGYHLLRNELPQKRRKKIQKSNQSKVSYVDCEKKNLHSWGIKAW